MTKDELKAYTDLCDEISSLKISIARQKEIIRDYEADRKRWHETIIMSSTDEACRPVSSRVVSNAVDTEEAHARELLRQDSQKLIVLIAERNSFLELIESWLANIPDWRIREIFRKRYVDGMSVKEVSMHMGYNEGSIKNRESLFWKNK